MGQFLYPVTKFKGDATAGRDKGFLCCPPDAVLEHGLSKRAAGPARRRRKPLMCAYRPGDVIGTRGALTEHGRRIIPEDIGGAIRRGIVYDRPAGETVIRKGQTRRRGDGYPHGQGDRQP